MRITRAVIVSASVLVALGGCSAILGIEPTDVIGGMGDGDGGSGGDGTTGPSDGSTPLGDGAANKDSGPLASLTINAACVASQRLIDPSADEASAIVVDDLAIFWAKPTNASNGEIDMQLMSSPTQINPIVSAASNEPSIVGLALDTSNLYWTSWNTYAGAGPTSPASVAEYSRLNQSITRADLSEAGAGVSEITIANNKVFFGNWLTPGSANLYSLPISFMGQPKPFKESGGLESPLHFASDAHNVYYDEALGGDLSMQNEVAWLSQLGNPDEVDRNTDDVHDLVVGAGSEVYWAQTNDQEIQMHGPTFDASTQTFSNAIGYPHALAYDSDHQMLYVISSSQSDVYSVQRLSTVGATPTALTCVDGLTAATAIQYWNGHVYFSGETDHDGSGLYDLTIK